MADGPLNSTFYTIRIQEKLDERWGEWFEDMTVTADGDGTLIAGYLPDQSALHGVIGRVHRLGLQLVSVNRTSPPVEVLAMEEESVSLPASHPSIVEGSTGVASIASASPDGQQTADPSAVESNEQ